MLTLLTDGSTQVRAVAKGARKPGAKLAGVVGLGNEVELLLRRGRSLDIVTEGTLVVSRAGVSAELEREAIMELMLEVACELTAEGEHPVRMLPLTTAALDALGACRTTLLPLLAGAYVLKAIAMQGYRPVLSTCVGCGEPVSLRAGERACLSFVDGGVLCESCADAAGLSARTEAGVLGWADALVGMRFSELLALGSPVGGNDAGGGSAEGLARAEGQDLQGVQGAGSISGDAGAAEARTGLAVLAFCRDWLGHFPGIRPRALDFVLSLDTFEPPAARPR